MASTKDSSPSSNPFQLSRVHQVFLIVTLSFTQALQEAGFGIVISPLEVIGDSLGAETPAELSWFASSYSLTVGTFILLAGRWGDIWGHKRVLVFGWVWFAVWSIVIGFSVYSGQILFDICRAFQGIGPALVIPNAIAIIGRVYPEPGLEKNIVFGLFGSMAATGFVFGSLLGALLGQLAWWPIAFWIFGAICFAVAIMSFFAIPDMGSVRKNKGAKGECDVIGSFLALAGLILFNFAWNQSGIVGWVTPYEYILLIVGVALLVAFVVYEQHAPFPLVPVTYFTVEATFTLVVISAGFASFGIWNYYIYRFLEVSRRLSPLGVTAQLTPIIVSGAAAAVASGYLLHRFGSSFVLFYAMLSFLVAAILIATAPVGETYWARTFVSIVVTSFGIDAAFPSSTVILSNAMPEEHQGAAASIVNTIVNYSIALGLGIAGTVARHVNHDGRDSLLGFRGAFYVGIGLAGLGVVIALSFVVSEYASRKKQRVAEK